MEIDDFIEYASTLCGDIKIFHSNEPLIIPRYLIYFSRNVDSYYHKINQGMLFSVDGKYIVYDLNIKKIYCVGTTRHRTMSIKDHNPNIDESIFFSN
jgi:hypothetical protein